MGSSQADKAASHERIIDAAAVQIRRHGIAGLSVAGLMNEAGLTHGGFYRHFSSLDALVAEAIEVALEQSERQTAHPAPGSGAPRTMDEFIEAYLSPDHRDDPGNGCAVAALACDMSRRDEGPKAPYTQQVRRYLRRLGSAMPDRIRETDDAAYLTLAALVGALMLARAVDDDNLADELLARTSRELRRLAARG